MMTVNCYSLTLLSKLMLSKFKRRWREEGKRSLIINTSAIASIAPTPFLQIFSSTKIFCDYVTEGLNFELA